MVKAQTLKGFRDFLPKEAIKRNLLKNKIQEIFELWGYDPLETPTLEPLELFAGQIGEDEKLFFQFKDRGGRQVALRYDQTVPASRVVGQYQNEIPLPFKRYQIQSAFRSEKPQRGRYREFLQCDADIFGIPSPAADAEVIALSLDIYRKLKVPKAVVKVNDRALLKDIPYEAIVAIDKLKKIGEDGVIKDMKSKGISETQAKEYLQKVINLKPNSTINTIFTMLEEYGFSKEWYEFDPTLSRSFAYSDGPIWEVVIPDYTAGSVLGGERYDKLTAKISGREVPATGFAVGFDRTLEALEQLKLIPIINTTAKVLVTVFNEKLYKESIKIANVLRENGINTDIYPETDTKMDKQLKYADQKQIPYTIIIGPKEVEKDMITLKNLKTGEQKEITLDAVLSILSS